MTTLQFTTVLVLALLSWGGMCVIMRKMQRSVLSMTLLVLCLALMFGAFALGSHWNHDDFTCHPGQHCFPWGD